VLGPYLRVDVAKLGSPDFSCLLGGVVCECCLLAGGASVLDRGEIVGKGALFVWRLMWILCREILRTLVQWLGRYS